jgi:RNA polymerase sigma factor (sigma-70 family)
MIKKNTKIGVIKTPIKKKIINNNPHIKYKTFEECISIIDEEIVKRKNKWTLSSIAWLDYEDVSQILRIHINKKWHLYDQSKPLLPFLNVIISHQIKNLIRNIYSNYSRPCLKCRAAIDNDGCKIYKIQCNSCPLFANWQRRKEPANNIKVPLSIENHQNEVYEIQDENLDIAKNILILAEKMKEILKPTEYLVFKGLYIDDLTEEQISKKLGFISNEKGRVAGYKTIKNIIKSIVLKAKKSLNEGNLDLWN